MTDHLHRRRRPGGSASCANGGRAGQPPHNLSPSDPVRLHGCSLFALFAALYLM
jgi:hypothetical protein